MMMPFANLYLDPEEVVRLFDQELEKARTEGRLPEFFTYALRKETVARAEIFQLLTAKLSEWLIQEQDLRRQVEAIGGRQGPVIEMMTKMAEDIATLSKQIVLLQKGMGSAHDERGALSSLLRESQASLVVWFREDRKWKAEVASQINSLRESIGVLSEFHGGLATEVLNNKKKQDSIHEEGAEVKEEVTGVKNVMEEQRILIQRQALQIATQQREIRQIKLKRTFLGGLALTIGYAFFFILMKWLGL